MEFIYSLNTRLDKKESVRSLVYENEKTLYFASIKKYAEHNLIHRVLEKSFEYCTIKNGDSPLNALFKYGYIYSEGTSNVQDYILTKLTQQPGAFYPRIFRPFVQTEESLSFYDSQKQIERLKEELLKYPDFISHDISLRTMAVNQLGALKEILLSIFDTTYPAPSNLNSFGQKTKNLLVLSCIEVETQLKGILKANEMTSKNIYTTKDYVKLRDILRLDKYSVAYPYYPDLKAFKPFNKWSTSNPTTSLTWYDSYNAIKHNGESDFHKATLENAISAFSAVGILLKAQYGGNIPFWDEKIGNIMEITDTVTWKTNDRILPPLIKGQWNSKKLSI